MIDEFQDGDWAAQKGNYREAYQILVHLLDGKDDRAYLRLGDLARNRHLTQDEVDDLEQRLLTEIKGNILSASFTLGMVYWSDGYRQKSLENAMRMLAKACQGGYARSCLCLARLYREQRNAFAFASAANIMILFQRAFELGSIDAAIELSHAYAGGELVEKDDQMAFRYLYMAGSLGNAVAVKEAKLMLSLQATRFEAARKQADELMGEMQGRGVVFF